MVSVRIADIDADGAAIRRVRFAVFVDEQRVPAGLEMDDRDRECVHVLALVNGLEVGTGRIDLAQAGKIGRVAVVAPSRGRGVGTALMERLHAIAAAHGLAKVWCHAQVAAVPFYAQLGYRASGDVFFEADIAHVQMERDL